MNKKEFLEKIQAILDDGNRSFGDSKTPIEALAWFSAFQQGQAFAETNGTKDVARMFFYGINWVGTKTRTTVEDIMLDYVGEMYGCNSIEEYLEANDWDAGEILDEIKEFFPPKPNDNTQT